MYISQELDFFSIEFCWDLLKNPETFLKWDREFPEIFKFCNFPNLLRFSRQKDPIFLTMFAKNEILLKSIFTTKIIYRKKKMYHRGHSKIFMGSDYSRFHGRVPRFRLIFRGFVKFTAFHKNSLAFQDTECVIMA